MTTTTWLISALVLVVSAASAGFVTGHITAPQPIETVRYVPAPDGVHLNVPVRITTGDGTGYVYECDLYLTADGQVDQSVCSWPDGEDVSALLSP